MKFALSANRFRKTACGVLDKEEKALLNKNYYKLLVLWSSLMLKSNRSFSISFILRKQRDLYSQRFKIGEILKEDSQLECMVKNSEINNGSEMVSIFPYLSHTQKRIIALELGMHTKKLQYILRTTREKQRNKKIEVTANINKQINVMEIKDLSITKSTTKLDKDKKSWIEDYLRSEGIIERYQERLDSLQKQILFNATDSAHIQSGQPSYTVTVQGELVNNDHRSNNQNSFLEFTEETSNIGRVWQQINTSNGFMYFLQKLKRHLKQNIISRFHINRIQQVTKLNQYQIHHFINRYLAQPLSFIEKQTVKQWLRSLNGRLPTLEEKLWLKTRLNLSSRQIYGMIYHYNYTQKCATNGISIVRRLLKDRDVVTSVDIKSIVNTTRLSSYQVKNIVRYLKDHDGVITKNGKEKIYQWLHEKIMKLPQMKRSMLMQDYSIPVSTLLSSDELIQLQNETKLSKRQIRGLVNRYLDEALTKLRRSQQFDDYWNYSTRLSLTMEDRQQISSILNSNQPLTNDDKLHLQKKYNLSRQQLNQLLWRLRQSNSKQILNHHIKIVQNFLVEKKNVATSKQDVTNLMHLTGLSRPQIHYLLQRKLKYSIGNIDDSKRIKIFSWLVQNEFDSSSTMKVCNANVESLQLHPEQIRSILRHQVKVHAPYFHEYMRYIEEAASNQDLHRVKLSHENSSQSNLDNLNTFSNSVLAYCKSKYQHVNRRKLIFFSKYYLYKRNE